jgi:branched-chain amino acid transport system substrate-binding protein
MARPRRLTSFGLVACAGLTLVACGTRRPARDFESTPTSSGSAPTVPTSTPGANPASDVGVSTTEIRVGVIASRTSVLGPDAFSAPSYGAEAYFKALNARGGIHGRRVKVDVCDDTGSGAGNIKCVRKLIDRDHVFALAGTSAFQYAGASYVSQKDVPDIGGQPIGNEYEQYQHLYSIYGSSSPRNGTVGFGGKLYGGTEVYRYFKQELGAKTAEVVAYNQADSLRFADLTARGLKLEGYKVFTDQVDFGVANWDAVALNMKARHVDLVFDALESTGNVNLCNAMDRNGVTVKAKIMTVQGWSDTVRSDYGAAPTCRNSLYATSTDLNYADVNRPIVKQFRDDMQRYFPEREKKLSMWELEGWASAQWFTDAATSCGAQLDRACIEKYMNQSQPYDGHGLLTPRGFQVSPHPGAPSHNCLNVGRWQDSANGGKGAWVTQTPDMNNTCFDVPTIAYSP